MTTTRGNISAMTARPGAPVHDMKSQRQRPVANPDGVKAQPRVHSSNAPMNGHKINSLGR